MGSSQASDGGSARQQFTMSVNSAQFVPKQAISDTRSDPSPTRLARLVKNGPQSARNDTKGFFKPGSRFVNSSNNDSEDSVSELRRADQLSDDEEEKTGYYDKNK